MSKKYKFILTLSDNFEIDSEREIEGHVSWPNYSQAEPIVYKGVFDSYDEAESYASEFSIFKYVLNEDFACYDSSRDYYDDEEPGYYISIFDAEDAACRHVGIDPGDPYCVYPERYTIEKMEDGDEDREIPPQTYKYCLYYKDECVYDSVEEWDEYFDTYDEAQREAEFTIHDIKVETDETPYELIPIEIEKITIIEVEDSNN